MSFDVVCQSCGATSNPSVGMCPYCKSGFSHRVAHESGSLSKLRTLYHEGKLETALPLAMQNFEKEKEAKKKNVAFLVLYAKILLETEGPSSRVRNALHLAQTEEPNSELVNEYLEIVDAKGRLRHGGESEGELELRNVLKRSPKNVHALFILGAHQYWTRKETASSLHLLERCVRERPVFLRAWACLSTIYIELGNDNLAGRCLQKCIALETHPNMKKMFRELLAKTQLKAAA